MPFHQVKKVKFALTFIGMIIIISFLPSAIMELGFLKI